MANNEASDIVEEALSRALELMFEEYTKGDVLNHWVVVAHVANPDPGEGDGYPMLFSNGSVPTHVARGLLHTGLIMLQNDYE